MEMKRLLAKSLKEYEEKEINFQYQPFSQKFLRELFETHQTFGMSEKSYCCYGMERHCWVEVIEEDVWDLTLEEVKKVILHRILKSRKYLYDEKRFYVFQTNDACYLYIFLRDKVGEDYFVWFKK